MALKKFRPVTASSRFRSVSSFDEVTRSEPEKSLTEGLTKKSGRNHHGRITSRRRGGGHKRSTSDGTSTGFRVGLPRSSTTQTGRLASR
jgi:ribosomal protein L2